MEPAHPEHEEQILAIDLRRYLAALRKYIWLLAALIVLSIAGAVIYTTRQTPIYQATASVQVEPKLPDLLGTGDMLNVSAAGASAEYYKQQRQVLSSFTLLEKTVEQNDLIPKLLSDAERKGLTHDDQLELATSRLQLDVTVKYPEADRIFYISVKSPTPEDAKLIADAHVATYESYAKGLLQVSSSNASEALQSEFTAAEKQLRAAEQRIYEFQTQHGMVAVTIEAQQSLVQSNILSFTQKLNDARAQQIALDAKAAEMTKLKEEDVLNSPILAMGTDNASTFETLRGQYFTEKLKLIELSKDLGPKNTDYLIQKQKVDLLNSALQGEVRIILRGTQGLQAAQQQTTSGLRAAIDQFTKEAQKLSPIIADYNELVRQKKEYDDKYNILRARLSSMQMTGSLSSSISNVRGLDKAQLPTKPVSPNMQTNVTVAAVMALLAGILIIFLIVFLDRSIKSTGDATQAADAPVLGVIPQLELPPDDDRARDMYVHENPKSSIAECCRSLRTNILFSAADRQLKTIVVCSANPREGKTTSVLYLGTTMAQSGQRTLVIDTDMRRPRLHKSIGVPLSPGLSNLLIGEDDYDRLIKPTEVANLFILPCGLTPPNPAELLLTKRFETVLGELARRFDRIILDSPPIQAVTDAVVLSKRVDGVVLVVRASKTMRDELRRSARMIRDVGGSIVGVIVNELDARDSYYGYGYGGYGYGRAYYGSDEPDKADRTDDAA